VIPILGGFPILHDLFPRIDFAAIGSITGDQYASTFDINVKGALFTLQKALSLLPHGASILWNASMAGAKGIPAFSVYSASKAAVRSFARSWTMDLKHRKIRVNAISREAMETPGWVALGGTPCSANSYVLRA
jgi:NAD(P)-dependent dehydrogenase (short-subunit alcohol dehydrogenase family)